VLKIVTRPDYAPCGKSSRAFILHQYVPQTLPGAGQLTALSQTLSLRQLLPRPMGLVLVSSHMYNLSYAYGFLHKI